MAFIGASTASGRAKRRRRAAAAVACVFLGGASVGAAVGLTYTQTVRRQYEKAFDSIGLTSTQRRMTDSILSRYACVIDSMNQSMAPHVDSIRRAARQDVLEILSDSQVARLNRALAPPESRRGQHHSDKHGLCDRGADSTQRGHQHFLKI